MSVIPGIIIFGGVIFICLYLMQKSSKNTCRFSCHETNNVYVCQNQIIMKNTLENSSRKSHPLGHSREIQPFKKQN